MLLNHSQAGSKQSAYALPMVLVFAAIGLITLTAALDHSSQSSVLTERRNQLSRTINAAEAASEKVLAQMQHDFKADGERQVRRRLRHYRSQIPSARESTLWNDYLFTDHLGRAGTHVSRVSSRQYVALNSKYQGLNGFASTYRIVSNARELTGRYPITNAVMQEVQLASIPVFQFAIFYNSLLEFTWAAPLTFRGRVHANSNIYTGSSAPLRFTDNVTATGIIKKRSWAGYQRSRMTGSITYEGHRDTKVNSLTLPIGTNNTAAAVREILKRPPVGESRNSPMGQQRFFNKAEMSIIVKNTGLQVQVKRPFDPTPTLISQADAGYFINTSKKFRDDRETKIVKVTEIDVAKFRTWAATNREVIRKLGGDNPPNILYVEDTRRTRSSEMAGIRLVNGRRLPRRGLTVATPNPLYVKGHYNQPRDSYLGTTNTHNVKPASLVSDAVTIQSSNWRDGSLSSRGVPRTPSLRYRSATHTTINAALLTGIVYAGGRDGRAPPSGGVVNYPRLLENWGNGRRRLTINGSIVNLFNSAQATAPFRRPGYYYYAPTRDFNFDPNFKDVAKLPPGTPELRTLIRGKWKNLLPGRIN